MYAYNSIKDKWSKGNWSKEIERTLILISHFEFCILNFPVCVCVLIAMSIFCNLSGSNIAVFFFSVIVLRNFVNSLKYLKYVTVQFYFFFLDNNFQTLFALPNPHFLWGFFLFDSFRRRIWRSSRQMILF